MPARLTLEGLLHGEKPWIVRVRVANPEAGDEAAEAEARRGKRGVESFDLTWPSSWEAAQSTSVEASSSRMGWRGL